jgi:serine/threonine protein kinase
LKAETQYKLLEWIEHDRLENIEYLAKGGFGTMYKAIWKDGPIESWNSENNQWKREKTYREHSNYPVALKCLHNSKDITAEFLSEVRFL